MPVTITDADRAMLRQLARRAVDGEDSERTASIALKPASVPLALALDPDTVLALLTEVEVLRGVLRVLSERWERYADDYADARYAGEPLGPNQPTDIASGIVICVDELRRAVEGDLSFFEHPPRLEPDDDEEPA